MRLPRPPFIQRSPHARCQPAKANRGTTEANIGHEHRNIGDEEKDRLPRYNPFKQRYGGDNADSARLWYERQVIQQTFC